MQISDNGLIMIDPACRKGSDASPVRTDNNELSKELESAKKTEEAARESFRVIFTSSELRSTKACSDAESVWKDAYSKLRDLEIRFIQSGGMSKPSSSVASSQKPSDSVPDFEVSYAAAERGLSSTQQPQGIAQGFGLSNVGAGGLPVRQQPQGVPPGFGLSNVGAGGASFEKATAAPESTANLWSNPLEKLTSAREKTEMRIMASPVLQQRLYERQVYDNFKDPNNVRPPSYLLCRKGDCEALFADNTAKLIYHEMTCKDVKEYSCGMCGSLFSDKVAARAHVYAAHILKSNLPPDSWTICVNKKIASYKLKK